jgi:hypothetical protein
VNGEEKAMMYIVEIENRSGETATKEYQAGSIAEVVRHVEFDLRDYPGFHLLHVTARSERLHGEHDHLWSFGLTR